MGIPSSNLKFHLIVKKTLSFAPRVGYLHANSVPGVQIAISPNRLTCLSKYIRCPKGRTKRPNMQKNRQRITPTEYSCLRKGPAEHATSTNGETNSDCTSSRGFILGPAVGSLGPYQTCSSFVGDFRRHSQSLVPPPNQDRFR